MKNQLTQFAAFSRVLLQRLVRPLKYLACVYWGIGVLGETQSYMTAIGLIALGCVLIAEGDLNDERQKVNDVLRERLDIAHRRIDVLRARVKSPDA